MSSTLRNAERKRQREQQPQEYFYIQRFYAPKNDFENKRQEIMLKELGVKYFQYLDGSKELLIISKEKFPNDQVIDMNCQLTGQKIGEIVKATPEQVEEFRKLGDN